MRPDARLDPTRDRHVDLREVEQWVAHAAQAYRVNRGLLDPWQAMGIAQSLRRRGLRAEEFAFTSASTSRIATTLMMLIRERQVAIPRDDELLDELRNVRLREIGANQYRVDHDPDGHDDRVISLGMAAVAIVSGPSVAPASPELAYVGTHTAFDTYIGSDGFRQNHGVNPWVRVTTRRRDVG